MKDAFSTIERSSSKRRLLGSIVTAAVAVGAILASAGPAAAAGSGSGVFTGVETAPNSTLVNPPLPSLCANFTPTATAPLIEKLHMRGTLSYNGSVHGDATTPWTATYTNSSNAYWASPVGTFTSQASCTSVPPGGPGPGGGGGHVNSDASPNGVVIKDANGTTVCSGSGYYERHATSAITIQMTNGSCGTGTNPSTVTFTGTEEACPTPPVGPQLGCPDPADPGNLTLYDALLDGVYQQS